MLAGSLDLPDRNPEQATDFSRRTAGYRAIVQPDPDGNWLLVVHGSEEQIRTLKDGIAAAAEVDGEG